MSKKLTFTGYSDDVFLLYVNSNPSGQIDSFDRRVIFLIKSNNEQLLVIGEYISDVWMIGVAQVNEDTPLPNWTISIIQNPECGYSPLLEINCPDDVVISDFNNKEWF